MIYTSQSLLWIKTPLCTLHLAGLREQQVSNQHRQLLEPSSPRLIHWLHLGLRDLLLKPQSQVRTKGYGKTLRWQVLLWPFLDFPQSCLPPPLPSRRLKLLSSLVAWHYVHHTAGGGGAGRGKGTLLFLDFNYHWSKVKLDFHFITCFVSIDLKSL